MFVIQLNFVILHYELSISWQEIVMKVHDILFSDDHVTISVTGVTTVPRRALATP